MLVKSIRKVIAKTAKVILVFGGFFLILNFLLLILESIDMAPYNAINWKPIEAILYYLGATFLALSAPLLMPKSDGFGGKLLLYFGFIVMFFWMYFGYRDLFDDYLPGKPVFYLDYVVFLGMSVALWYRQTRKKLENR